MGKPRFLAITRVLELQSKICYGHIVRKHDIDILAKLRRKLLYINQVERFGNRKKFVREFNGHRPLISEVCERMKMRCARGQVPSVFLQNFGGPCSAKRVVAHCRAFLVIHHAMHGRAHHK